MPEYAGQRLIARRIERGVKRADARARRKYDPNRKPTPTELARRFRENVLHTMSKDRAPLIDLKRQLYHTLMGLAPDDLTVADVAIMHELADDPDMQRIFDEARAKETNRPPRGD